MRIRDADTPDIDGIVVIYNDAVLNTTAIWNETTIDAANRAAWLADRRRVGYPVLVAADDEGRVLGYASFGDSRAWEGYRHTVEHPVYVSRERRGMGIGKRLVTALIDRASSIGKHVMIAGIEAENAGSFRGLGDNDLQRPTTYARCSSSFLPSSVKFFACFVKFLQIFLWRFFIISMGYAVEICFLTRFLIFGPSLSNPSPQGCGFSGFGVAVKVRTPERRGRGKPDNSIARNTDF
jgi:phosphinothricin acetyltransferase